MATQELIERLHPLERKVLPVLKNHSDIHEIVKASGLLEVEVVRALQWLSNKEVLTLESRSNEMIVLDEEGKKYIKSGFPEKIFLSALVKGEKTAKQVIKAGITEGELNSSIGLLKKEQLIEVKKDKEILFSITQKGREFLKKELPQEVFIKTLPQTKEKLSVLEQQILSELLRRKQVVTIQTQKTKKIMLTSLGKKVVLMKLDETLLERITPELLRSGSWKDKKFRGYDVEINVPQVSGGKRHFVNQAQEYAKKIWLDMGFKEMTGPHVVSGWWNFDALFTPQDHPAREMHDTFFLAPPHDKAKLESKKLVAAVKETHMSGAKTGSRGWGGLWSEEEASRVILRTHTTATSAQTLASLKKEDLPAKYFSLAKCFRNETVDATHLFDFNQTDGIVVDPNATFTDLLGYLKQFFKKMGFEHAQFRPAHYPYTEPSVGIYVFHPVHNKWLGIGGAGLFRPEVVVPLLGFDCPVLAWGPGFDRIMLDYYAITDIRDLYNNDLKQLREIKQWVL